MESSKKESLAEFLKEYGIDITKLTSTKEQKQILKKIVDNAKLEQDLAEIRYRNSDKSISIEEYTKTIDSLFINQMYASEYILRIKCIERENRKLKRKEFMKKRLSIFKK